MNEYIKPDFKIFEIIKEEAILMTSLTSPDTITDKVYSYDPEVEQL